MHFIESLLIISSTKKSIMTINVADDINSILQIK